VPRREPTPPRTTATQPATPEEKTSRNAPIAREKPSRTFRPAPAARNPRRRELCPRRQLSQRERERERERRVSDADASYKGPARSTRTLKHVIPQRNHAKYNPLSKRPGTSPKAPAKTLVSTTETDPTTRPYVLPHPNRTREQQAMYTTHNQMSSPRTQTSLRHTRPRSPRV
jgi:hypothetical protein